ncbi:MAG: carboxymuconolactone decarboxylase family protein [Bdellovibrionota bacterium]
MSNRVQYFKFAAKSMQKLTELSQVTKEGSLDAKFIDLIQLRASQLNHCTFCVDMHAKEAKIHGEKELRLYHLPVWRESKLFTEKERVALEFTEALTQLGNDGISDELYGKTKEHFTDQELVDLTYAIGVINLWNRMNAVFRTEPGIFDKMFGLDKSGL